jgi:ligand-binding sensor domain-containing protein/two-component sensor histidine kinase
VQDNQGNVWFGTRESGLNRYDGNEFTNFAAQQGLSDVDIVSSFKDSKGNLWFGTRNSSIIKYDGKNFFSYKGLPGQPVRSIHSINEDNEGNLWFGSYNNGIACYDGDQFKSITVRQGLPHDIVSSITKDGSGNLWFGTYGGGAGCYRGKAFSFLTTAQGLADNTVRNIIEDRKGNYWFGLNTGGVCKYDGKTITNFFRSQGLMDNKGNRIFEDWEGNLWFCTGYGVYKFDGRRLTNFSKLQGLAYNAVRCVAEDNDGNMWFGTERGLSKFDGKFFYNFTKEQHLPSSNVRDILEDEDGTMWLGTHEGGLVRYDGKNFLILDTAHGLTGNFINNLTKDSRGNLWICGGTRGLSVLRRETIKKLHNPGEHEGIENYFENFTTNEGLSDNTVYDAVEDKKGNIIVGTNFGITIIKGGLDPEKPITRDQLEYYNWKNGNYIKDVNTQSMYVDRKGIIWIGTGDKLVRFDYSAVKKDMLAPLVRIHGLKINNETVGWYNLLSQTGKSWLKKINDLHSAISIEEKLLYKRSLTQKERDSLRFRFGSIEFDSITRFYALPVNLVLPYKHNNITFEFGAIEPARPSLVRYQYMLEGYDKDWNPVTEKSSANFGNMNEGRHVFKVKAMSPDGIWSKPISYSFTVLPPYWRTWWFRSLYIIGFIALLFLLIRLRINVVRKNEQRKVLHEKELLEMEARALRAQMNPHFIFNCLNSIKALMQKQETEKGVIYLTTFSKLIRTLFHNSDKRQISLYDEIETCKLYTQLEAMRLNGKLTYSINIDPNLDLKSVMVPALIIQPFIENAIWHGIVPKDAGTINITISGDEYKIVCEVEDNGIGREMSKRNRPITPTIHESKGVHLSQQRLNLQKILDDTSGTIEIIDKYESSLATGTKVRLTFTLG